MEFVEMYDKKLNNKQIGQILHSTVLNINSEDQELTEIAIQALSRAIPSTAENFANDEQRTFIVDGLFKAAEMGNASIEEVALQAISETPFVGYTHIASMIERMGVKTMSLMQTDRYSAIRFALLFWTNLARVELRMIEDGQSQNIIQSCLESLLQIMQTGLEITELDIEADIQLEDAEDDQKWTVHEAAANLLQEISAIAKEAIFNQFMEYATNKLQADDWINQYVGMSIIARVLVGPSSETIYFGCKDMWQSLFQLLQST